MQKNIFGEPLITCSNEPLTGFFTETSTQDMSYHIQNTPDYGTVSVNDSTVTYIHNNIDHWPNGSNNNNDVIKYKINGDNTVISIQLFIISPPSIPVFVISKPDKYIAFLLTHAE